MRNMRLSVKLARHGRSEGRGDYEIVLPRSSCRGSVVRWLVFSPMRRRSRWETLRGSPKPPRSRWGRFALAVLAGFGAVSCGASIQAMYESDVRFEHCMALDSRP